MALGIVSGFVIGVALYFASIGMSALLSRFCMSERLSPIQWLASMTAVLLPAVSPFAAWVLSVLTIASVLHL